ncbi:DNA primase catalytic subunit PriS [Candidatus Micrarchaeota archaeon]|nr:DNA primase catalytic subunit PriS [Candidatus Micrarchaeota archaeon]
MNQEEKTFILNKFSEYYKNADFHVSQIERREFGIGNQKKIDARHLAFPTTSELQTYLQNNPPLFVSHSAAYYELPAATPITKKGWLGADVIFDLDLHSDTKYGVYLMLNKAKEDVIRLVEDFLISDFSIDKKDILIVFSGNRGYHVHVRANDYLILGSEERRELIDYVNGTGLDYKNFFHVEEIKKGVKKITGPKPTDAGYKGRFARETAALVKNSPSKISRKLGKERDLFLNGIEDGNWSRTSVNDLIEKLSVVAESLPLRSIGADAGVTYDISKLIRVPNSIHGETGLIARIVNDLTNFSPLDNAVAFSKGELQVELLEDVPSFDFGKLKTEELKKEMKKELPFAFGLFLVIKSSAKIIF